MVKAAIRFLFFAGIGYWVFDLVSFIWRRFGNDLPGGLGLFLSLTLPSLFLILPWIAVGWKRGVLIGSLLAAYLVGFLLFSHPMAVALSLLIGAALGVKALEVPGDSGRLFAWFAAGMGVKGLVFLLFFFSSFEPAEESAFFDSFLPYLLLLLLMYGLFPFQGGLKLSNPRVAKAWGMWNGRVLLGGALLFLASSLVTLLLVYAWNGVVPLLGRLISLLLASLFSFYPALKERVDRVIPPQAEVGIEGSRERPQEPPPSPGSPHLPALDLIVAGALFLLFLLLLFFIGRMVWRWMGKGMSAGNRMRVGDGKVMREPFSARDLPEESQGGSEPARSHQAVDQPIRLRMMEYLRLLKRKGKWAPSVTVGELVKGGVISGLPASLYEKIRYGEAALTDEEEKMALTALEQEIRRVEGVIDKSGKGRLESEKDQTKK